VSRYLSAADVASELGISLRTAYVVIDKAGAQPIGRLVKVSRENLDRWLAAERAAREASSPRVAKRNDVTRLGGSETRSREAPKNAPLIRPSKRRVKAPK
jgi:hypothetical protein